jgi:predicted amidophosphoribosyltransferase
MPTTSKKRYIRWRYFHENGKCQGCGTAYRLAPNNQICSDCIQDLNLAKALGISFLAAQHVTSGQPAWFYLGE